MPNAAVVLGIISIIIVAAVAVHLITTAVHIDYGFVTNKLAVEEEAHNY